MSDSPFVGVPQDSWLVSNDLAFAIYDRFPVGPGHVLVITKRVVPNWEAASLEERAAVMALVDQVLGLLRAEYQPQGFNVGFNLGAAAGQTVEHLHVHVIPRYLGARAGGDHARAGAHAGRHGFRDRPPSLRACLGQAGRAA